MRLFQTLVILLLWPWWTLRATVLCAIGVALIVSRQILDLWAGQPTGANKAQRKPL